MNVAIRYLGHLLEPFEPIGPFTTFDEVVTEKLGHSFLSRYLPPRVTPRRNYRPAAPAVFYVSLLIRPDPSTRSIACSN